MLKKYTLAFLMVSIHFVLTAQNIGWLNSNLNKNSNRLQGKLTGEVFYINPISNSNYFLQKDWEVGSIKLKDGDVFENMRMRYLAFGDQLIAYNNNVRSLFIVDKSTVKEFILNVPSENGDSIRQKFINLDTLDLPFNRSYFQELYSGTAKLLSFHLIEEEKVSPYIGPGGKMYDVEFRLKTMYYILSNGKGFSKIQLKNRSLFTLYPEQKKTIKRILKRNKINIVDEVSALEAFKMLDAEGFLK